jgi:hypothetical protein
LLVAGSFGYIVAFSTWFLWLLLVVSNLTAIKFGFYPTFMSGIFFQSGPYHYIFHSLLSISFLLGSLGWFGLKRTFKSDLAFICGIFYVVVFAFLSYSVVEATLFISYALFYLFFGILVWGLTLTCVRRNFHRPKLAMCTGIALAVVAILSLTLFMPVVLYWGIEFWLMLFGWLYGFAALVTFFLLFRLSKRIKMLVPRSSPEQ